MTYYPTTPTTPPNCSTEQDRHVLHYVRAEAEIQNRIVDADGRHYTGVADFLLRHGQFWQPAPLPRCVKPMPIRMCYHNSQLLARRRKGLRYVEGVALGVIPTHHAWCVDPDGRVIDATWASVEPSLLTEHGPIGTSYFGVELPMELVREVMSTDRARLIRAQSVFYAAPMSFWRKPFTARTQIVMTNEMINSVCGKEVNSDQENETEKGTARRRRPTVEVSRQEPIETYSGLSDG